MSIAFAVIIAYLLGSIPFGYLIVRVASGTDVRATGSGGTGATNVSRRAGKLAGLVTLLLDAAKGAVAILIAQLLLKVPEAAVTWGVATAAIAVVVGHIFPVWLRFRGGKGVATAVGIFLTLEPLVLLFAGIIFFLIVISTRYVSLASIISSLSIPVVILLQHLLARSSAVVTPLLITALVIALLIVFAHRGNIRRLLAHTESKFR